MIKWTPSIILDTVTTLPVILLALGAALINPFGGERIAMVYVAIAGLVVIYPSFCSIFDIFLSSGTALFLTVLYFFMLIAGTYILIYDFSSGSFWIPLITSILLISIAKSIKTAWVR